MAVIEVASQNPTLSEIANGVRPIPAPEQGPIRREEVVAACKLRDIPIRDGRVFRGYLPPVYSGLRELRGVPTEFGML